MANGPQYSDVVITEALTAVHFLVYGVYSVLFTLCVYILLKNRTQHYRYLLSAITLLFILVSAHVILCAVDDAFWFCNAYSCYWQSEHRREHICTAKFEALIASSAVADAILLWRCYTIWGKRWRVIALPMVLYLGCHVAGFVLDSPQSQAVKEGYKSSNGLLIGSIDIAAIAAGAIGLNNLLLSSLIAFRFIKTKCGVLAYLSPRTRTMYRTAIAATLESGLVYSAFVSMIFFVEVNQLWADLPDDDTLLLRHTVVNVGLRAWPSLAGIMSNIIIVRVALDVVLHSENSGTTLPLYGTTANSQMWISAQLQTRTV